MRLLTQQESESGKVGRGREEPNKDPFLPYPVEGRGFMDMFSGIGDILGGIGGIYDGLIKVAKLFAIILAIGVAAYVFSTLLAVVKK
jgi:hypothetical protein